MDNNDKPVPWLTFDLDYTKARFTDFDPAGDLVEMALAHTINSKVEAADRRGGPFEERRPLMIGWAKFRASSRRMDMGAVVTIGVPPISVSIKVSSAQRT